MAKNQPPPYFSSIHADFPAHDAFRKERKILEADGIMLERRQNISSYIGELSINTALLAGECFWVATHSFKARVSYRFALRAEAYGEEPCFRFDSCGLPHRNDIGTLTEQQIPTPHFHWVCDDGIMRAYQTPELADPVQGSAIANDPQLGANHFCQELNLATPSGGNLAFRIADRLGLPSADPLDGASFPYTP